MKRRLGQGIMYKLVTRKIVHFTPFVSSSLDVVPVIICCLSRNHVQIGKISFKNQTDGFPDNQK